MEDNPLPRAMSGAASPEATPVIPGRELVQSRFTKGSLMAQRSLFVNANELSAFLGRLPRMHVNRRYGLNKAAEQWGEIVQPGGVVNGQVVAFNAHEDFFNVCKIENRLMISRMESLLYNSDAANDGIRNPGAHSQNVDPSYVILSLQRDLLEALSAPGGIISGALLTSTLRHM